MWPMVPTGSSIPVYPAEIQLVMTLAIAPEGTLLYNKPLLESSWSDNPDGGSGAASWSGV